MDGQPRKVGVEVEFAGVDTAKTSHIVAEELGGEVEVETKHRHFVRNSSVGDVKIELDTKFAHPNEKGERELLRKSREILGEAVRSIVPQEVVTAPIPVKKLHLLDTVTDALAAAGGKGTHDSLVYAFGLHLNPEIAEDSVRYLLSIIRAMILLDADIRKALDIDFARRTMGWAQSYTKPYEKLVMDPDYAPEMKTLIEDYIKLNKGRNHHLDMLPIFAHFDEDTVSRLVEDDLISARPAFHFRLPDCGLGSADWTIREAWEAWVKVEAKAEELTDEVLEDWKAERHA